MKFRTGDILIWRSTCFPDMLGENTILLPGFHSGIILKGDRIGKYSACGKSPSSTYVTFLIDKIFPIEELIGHIWTKPNGCSLYIVKRIGGNHIPQSKIVQVYKQMLNLESLSHTYTVRLAIFAYLKMGGVDPEPGYKNKKYHFCPSITTYFLSQFGLLQPEADLNSLLPVDFYNCKFYQNVEYQRVDIFHKQTNSLKWLFSSPLIHWGFIKPQSQTCPTVETILKDYNYPRTFVNKQVS